jgi:hypothetical protein
MFRYYFSWRQFRQRSILIMAVTVLAVIAAPPVGAQSNTPFPSTLDLGSLTAAEGGDGSVGFVIIGEPIDNLGWSVSTAGDFNGDGIDDVIVGAYLGDPSETERFDAGYALIIFGTRSGFPAEIGRNSLDGTNGFRLNGVAFQDSAGHDVSSAGDVNGDGYDDILISAMNTSVSGENRAGSVYVVFGGPGPFPATFELSALDGTNGLVLNGIDRDDYTGVSVAGAGDVNRDGFDDILIGALLGRNSEIPNSSGQSGAAYLIYGSAGPFPGSLSLSSLDGTNGTAFRGAVTGDNFGVSVSPAGDMNQDGFPDLLIGARGADLGPNTPNAAGRAFVVFGRSDGFPANVTVPSEAAPPVFNLNGVRTEGFLGEAVSSGDINGDGAPDLILGAPDSDPVVNFGEGPRTGQVFVVFGPLTGAGSFSMDGLQNGINGFVLNGADPADNAGDKVAGIGDVNGDGLDDFIIGAFSADTGALGDNGEAYVVYGRQTSSQSSIALGGLDGNDGFTLTGFQGSDAAGRDVGPAGDVNGDGIADFIIGANRAGRVRNFNTGSAYVVFGRRTGPFDLVAAILPTARAAQVGSAVSAFATIVNRGSEDAIACRLSPPGTFVGNFLFQTTDPATNLPTGSPNTPVNIPAGQFQTFVFAFTPTAAFPDRDLEVRYDCANTVPAPSISGLNRFRMSASETPPPDLVAVSATVTNNGVVRLPSTSGAGFFTASAINIGAPGTITARVRAPEGIAATITICETDSGGICLAARSDSTTRAVGTNDIVFYAVFVRANGEIPFNPAATRLILELSDDTGAVRGATSVAVRTP